MLSLTGENLGDDGPLPVCHPGGVSACGGDGNHQRLLTCSNTARHNVVGQTVFVRVHLIDGRAVHVQAVFAAALVGGQRVEHRVIGSEFDVINGLVRAKPPPARAVFSASRRSQTRRFWPGRSWWRRCRPLPLARHRRWPCTGIPRTAMLICRFFSPPRCSSKRTGGCPRCHPAKQVDRGEHLPRLHHQRGHPAIDGAGMLPLGVRHALDKPARMRGAIRR